MVVRGGFEQSRHVRNFLWFVVCGLSVASVGVCARGK